MPLPVAEIERELVHTRRVRYEGYRRADGLWDIEAHLSDVKNHDYTLKTGVRRAGQPIHEMALRVTIDAEFTIVDVLAVSDANPYPPGCARFGDVYRRAIGLNLSRGLRKQVAALLGGVQGCTHLTEMLAGLPSAAIQTFAGEMGEEREDAQKPFQLDHCHALDTTSDTVRRYYPTWYRTASAGHEESST